MDGISFVRDGHTISIEVTNPITNGRILIGSLQYNDLIRHSVIDPNNLPMYDPREVIISYPVDYSRFPIVNQSGSLYTGPPVSPPRTSFNTGDSVIINRHPSINR